MIEMGDQYYRAGDDQMRPVRLLCVDANAECCVVYLDEDRCIRYCTADGRAYSSHAAEANQIDPWDLLPAVKKSARN